MPRENYQKGLDELRTDVVGMGELVMDRYESAIDAAATGGSERAATTATSDGERARDPADGDPALAARVIDGDDEVNERYLELEERCTELLALQQPVAGDLRLVTASFKIITDLERIADLAVNLAEYGHPETGGIHPAVDIHGIGELAGELVVDALDAYERADPEACRAVAARDDELDERCRLAAEQVVRELVADQNAETSTAGGTELAAALDEVSRALLTVRDLERVGDHAVNIAARSLYMIESDDELIY